MFAPCKQSLTSQHISCKMYGVERPVWQGHITLVSCQHVYDALWLFYSIYQATCCNNEQHVLCSVHLYKGLVRTPCGSHKVFLNDTHTHINSSVRLAMTMILTYYCMVFWYCIFNLYHNKKLKTMLNILLGLDGFCNKKVWEPLIYIVTSLVVSLYSLKSCFKWITNLNDSKLLWD